MLTKLDLVVLHPLTEGCLPLLDPVVVVADQIAFNRDGPSQNLPVVVGPGYGFRGVIGADGAIS